jgi:protein-S-isoprenylcysteine O-methyltransferase Ste14
MVFIALNVGLEVAFCRVVPASHRQAYAQCRKDGSYYLAVILWHWIWITAAIQSAVAPESVPDWQRIGGIVFFLTGHALLFWARRVNPFFLPTLVKPDYLVKTGPYTFTRSPGYVGMSLAAHGTLLLLGQWWAVFPVLAYQILILRRAIVEDRFLSDQTS